MAATSAEHRKAIVGNVKGSFWLYDSLNGWDLTHPQTPTSPTVDTAVRIETTKLPIAIDPAKSALVIIDMQNFFLSTALGRPHDSKGLQAQKQLLQHAIPAARKAGIRVIWVNWGLTEHEICNMPVASVRSMGFKTVNALDFESYLTQIEQHVASQTSDDSEVDNEIMVFGKDTRIYCGLGREMKSIKLENGATIDPGRMLMRDQWNTALTPELALAFHEGKTLDPPDVWIHKNRLSAMWGESTLLSSFLDREKIKTLFFAGVNTDQCVGGTMIDAFSKGYDCILLSDGSATSNSPGCQETYEFNTTALYGFCTTCEELWKGVEARQK